MDSSTTASSDCLHNPFNHETSAQMDASLKGTVPRRNWIVNIIAEDYIYQASIGDA